MRRTASPGESSKQWWLDSVSRGVGLDLTVEHLTIEQMSSGRSWMLAPCVFASLMRGRVQAGAPHPAVVGARAATPSAAQAVTPRVRRAIERTEAPTQAGG